MEPEHIYHITTRDKWTAALSAGEYIADTVPTAGFMHCSTKGQVEAVLDRFFKGQSGLVKLTIDRSKVQRPLIFELASSATELFPHIYGALNLDAVVEITAL